MGSREKDQTAPHQPLLSSLVVRLNDSGGVGGGHTGGMASDYEPGEVRRDPPPLYSRSDTFRDDHGYRMRAGSVSPGRGRLERRYSPHFDYSGNHPRSRGYGDGRNSSRYGDYSPPHYGRGTDGDRISRKVFGGSRYGTGTLRGDAGSKNNPNVQPREGDWYCPDTGCNNLNFARRDFCNNCKRPRYGPGGSPPRRGYPGPPPARGRRFPGPPSDRFPGRFTSGYRSPPRYWERDDPRDLRGGGSPYPRYDDRFPDHPPRRDRPEYLDDYREMNRLDRPVPLDLAHRDPGRENPFHERKGYEQRPPSPPLPEYRARGQWARDIRERSRSPPLRGGAPPKDYHVDMFTERGRDNRRGGGVF